MAKLKIKCNSGKCLSAILVDSFYSLSELEGCVVIVELEHLQDHRTSCKYNPNSEIICDKECDVKIRRHEYDEAHKCIAHLSNRMRHQEYEITKLTCELIKNENFQPKEIRQEQQVKKIKEKIIRGQKTELNNQMIQLKEQIARRNDVVSEPKVGENSTISSLNKTPKWRVWKNVHFLDKSNILESERHYGNYRSV